MLVAGVLGFQSLVAALCLVVPAIVFFFARRKWRLAVARQEEIKRLLVRASEESARAELEAAAEYGFVAASATVVAPNQCAVCYFPTTTRCARCKAVRYCSGKCQIIHWRQGHKDECHPPSPNQDFTDTDTDQKLHKEDCSEAFSDHFEAIEVKPVELFLSEKEKDRNSSSESCSTSFSGFSTSTAGSESSSDEASVSDGGSVENERFNENISSDSALNMKDLEVSEPLSPKFASLAYSASGGGATDKSKETKSSCDDGDARCQSLPRNSSLKEGPIAEPCLSSSGFWDSALDSIGQEVDSRHDDSSKPSISKASEGSSRSSSFNLFQNTYSGLRTKEVEEEVEFEDALTDELDSKKPLDETITTSDSEIRGFRTLNSETLKNRADNGHRSHAVNGHVKTSDLMKSRDHGSSVPTLSDLRSASSKDSAIAARISGNISSQVLDSSHVKTGLKTSVHKVVEQFRGPKIPFSIGSEIAGKYSDRGLFPYESFVKLYTWNKVELRPSGLVNCGNSCYANAVLQCLAFTPPLTAYFLQGLHSKDCVKKDWCFICEFERLILKAKDGKSPLSPIGIVSQLPKIGSQLGNGKEEDAHEFLRYAIDTMQSVCLSEAGISVSHSSEEETTLMGLTFGGYLRSKIKCMKCQNKSERHERMMDVTVEIEGNIGSLEDALRKFTSTETLDGENKYQCSRCKSYEKAKKKLTILEAPNVLTIALKRFQSGNFGKLNKTIKFPEILNMVPFMSGTSDKLAIYRLYGVIVHLDIMNAAFSGHYVCYVKNAHNKWFKADDSTVTPVDLDKVLSKGAYMLLYVRCSPRAPRLLRSRAASSEAKPRSQSSWLGAVSRPKPGSTNPTGYDSFYSSLNRLQRILEEDSSSDSSSLLSSTSDAGSCSTDSACTEDFSDYLFGEPGRAWSGPWRSPSDSDTCSSSPSSSPLSSVESGGPWRGGTDPFLASDITKQSRKLVSSSISSSRAKADSDVKYDVSLRRSTRERT